MPTADPAIQLDRVSRHYTMGETSVRAVNELSLSVANNEFLALLGSSGSGKSTLLNLIAGLDRPTSGSIFAHGQNIASLSSLELARYRCNTVGMIFQSFNLLPRMTLEENIELPLRLAEVDRAERPARVREALERVRLTHRLGHRPTELSGGEQQRVAIARALVNRPKILLADEPTGNLDSATGEAILTLLRELRTQLGMTIVMVTHERFLAEAFADRLAVLDGESGEASVHRRADRGIALFRPGLGLRERIDELDKRLPPAGESVHAAIRLVERDLFAALPFGEGIHIGALDEMHPHGDAIDGDVEANPA